MNSNDTQSSNIHSNSHKYNPNQPNVFLTQVHSKKQYADTNNDSLFRTFQPPTQLEKDIEYYIRALNTLIKKMANLEDELQDFTGEINRKRQEFVAMEKQADLKIEKMKAGEKIVVGKTAAVVPG